MKVATVMRAMSSQANVFEQVLIHTGQHYDDNMSRVFFEETQLRDPDVNLGIGSGTHAEQTAKVMLALEPVLLQRSPDWVTVIGDVNSTLAAALACAKVGIRVAHIEAGLRSFDRAMPEEVNRLLTDHLSAMLLCPSEVAVANLLREGIGEGVHVVGDVLYDAMLQFMPAADRIASPAGSLALGPGEYALATIHRAGNTDDPQRLSQILRCLEAAGVPVIFPVHPRTRTALEVIGAARPVNIRMLEPVSYVAMLRLERDARFILTDSGGVQREAFWLGVPCITLRDQTEWVETVSTGWNQLVGVDPGRVRAAVAKAKPTEQAPQCYGDGHAADRIAALFSES
ncbi:MAG: UDP-N-acetylglucosamine 2-epimerase (non-hydrolyzing) [Chloroflexota bacterium]|nr:UDP-N-acetylglucosamine 2-epimerase (non-hydrolyzing) [Chloroflexota bacterium]